MIFKKRKIIVTHSGSFHADDIFACATLSLFFKKNNIKYKLIRTRDEKIIKKADYVFDVGGIYDPGLNRFDHHQIGGAGERSDTKIPYASFGLVWKKFGLELCSGNNEIVCDIDKRLVQPIDAIDNGVSLMENCENIKGIYEYGIYGIISSYQNTWKERAGEKISYQRFIALVSFFETVLSREIKISKDRMELADIIEKTYLLSENKEIIEIPYHVSMSDAIRSLQKYNDVLYIIARSNKNWKVMAMRKDPSSFENRKPLPLNWTGKRGFELQKETGVSDAVFCHNAPWLIVAKTRIGAKKLAELALID